MTEPISGPPRWIVRTLVALALLALFVEFALYAGLFWETDSALDSPETSSP